MLRLVRDEPRSVGEIAAQFDVTQQAVSQHLQVLKEAGLVAETRDGTRRIYRIDADGVVALRSAFDAFWNDALAAFKVAAEREEQ